jgi:hypothetical protein
MFTVVAANCSLTVCHKVWCSLCRPTFAVRQGGPSASSTPQNGEPALACTALVRHPVLHIVLAALCCRSASIRRTHRQSKAPAIAQNRKHTIHVVRSGGPTLVSEAASLGALPCNNKAGATQRYAAVRPTALEANDKRPRTTAKSPALVAQPPIIDQRTLVFMERLLSNDKDEP